MSEFRIDRQTGHVYRLEGGAFMFFATFNMLGVEPSCDDARIECAATRHEHYVAGFEAPDD